MRLRRLSFLPLQRKRNFPHRNACGAAEGRAACYILIHMEAHPAHAHPLHATSGFAHPARNVLQLRLTPGMSVADFGAGSGAYVWPIAQALGTSGNVYVIDVQRDLLRRIHNEAMRRGYSTVKIIWADLEQHNATRLADQSLDLVLISNLLFQVPNKMAVLKEAHRILKKSGTLVVIDWSDSFGGMGPRKGDVVTKKAAGDFLLRSGFAPEEEFSAGAHHWGLAARPIHL